MGAPMSNIYICDVPLSNRYEHTYFFEDVFKQREFFDSRVIRSFADYTFLRQTWSIKVQATLAQARPWSYLFTTNTDTGFRNYYFIIRSEYINDNTTELFLELDVMQTYQHYTNLTPCFVEREHTDDDRVGANVVEEGLEFGDLVDSNTANTALGELAVVIASTLDLGLTTEEYNAPAAGGFYDGQYSGLNYYAVRRGNLPLWSTFMGNLDTWGKSDCLLAMWMYPVNLLTLSSNPTTNETGRGLVRILGTAEAQDFELYYPTSLGTGDDGYVPRNNKLLTYPYCHMYVTNNTGGTAAYRFERFSDPQDMRLRVAGALSAEGGCRIFPVSYEGTILNYKMGLDLGGFPTCAWSQDVYKLWLAQTQNTRSMANLSAKVTVAGGLFTAVGSAITGNIGGIVGGAGTAIHGGLQIGNLLAQQADKSLDPPQVKGGSSASVAVNTGFCTFSTVVRSIDRHHAEILDDYFDMYGYKTLRVKIPNKNHRDMWWYTKTIGANVVGQACAEDKRKIADIYDKGITFWRVPSLLGEYGMDNPIR